MRRARTAFIFVLAGSGLFCSAADKKPFPGSAPQLKSVSATGFQDINFGESIEHAFQKLIAKHHMDVQPDGKYKGTDGVVMETFDNDIVLWNYPLSNRKFKLAIRFNKNEKFYRYEISGENKNAEAFGTDLKEEVEFLGRVFEKKYGPAMTKNSPNIFDIKPGFVTAVWQWDSDTHEVFTGIGQVDKQYYTTAVVADNKLSKEERSSTSKEPDKDIEDAAKGL